MIYNKTFRFTIDLRTPISNNGKKLLKRNNNNNKNIYILDDNYLTNSGPIQFHPKGELNLSEFTQIEQIGKGTFGKIFSVKWNKNNQKYALKKEKFKKFKYIQRRQTVIKVINDFLEKTKNKGIIQIYSNYFEKNNDEYNYYELMEIGEKDWQKEINERRKRNLLYSEKELINITSQLIKALSSLQKNHITHSDIKPQNILRVNNVYKLCDFGEIRIMKKDGLVKQRIRGSELYMSPILFYGLKGNLLQVKHNTYKSDVFSLGMCLIYASTLYFNSIEEIREITDMKKLSIVLNKYLGKRYSNKFISFVYLMLQLDEQLRPDFIQLEEKLKLFVYNYS